MISIIIPTLDEEKVLESTLVALRKCTSLPYEIIVSDGGSTDKTLAIAKKYADIVVEHTDNQRQTIAEGRNEGAARAHGDILVFIDADVYIPDIDAFFLKAMQYFKKDERLQGLTVRIKTLPQYVTFSDRVIWGFVNLLYIVQNNLLGIGAASGEFQMIRKQAFMTVGGYNKEFIVGEDNEMFAALAKIGKTKIATDLYIAHTSRRAHSVGWGKLLWSWVSNMLYSKYAKKSLTKEWKVIR